MCTFLKCVVFWIELHSWQKPYTITSGDGRDKFQLCATPLTYGHSESSAVICFAKSRNFYKQGDLFSRQCDVDLILHLVLVKAQRQGKSLAHLPGKFKKLKKSTHTMYLNHVSWCPAQLRT